MKKILLVLAAVLVAGYAYASPYLTAWQMKSAAEAKDGDALARHIAFPELRQNLKDQVNYMLAQKMESQASDNPFAALGSALAGPLAERMVDAYVTPTSISRLMSGTNVKDAASKPPTDTYPGRDTDDTDRIDMEQVEMAYQHWDRFHVDVAGDNDQTVTFILSRQGIGWKLTNLVLPFDNI